MLPASWLDSLLAGEPGGAEQRQPLGYLIAPRLPKPGNGFGVPDMWRVNGHHVDQVPPQLRLPGQVGGQTRAVTVQPTGRQ